MNCWPNEWIAAAKAAGLAYGIRGGCVVHGDDAMRAALEVFAQAVAGSAEAAERERWRPVLSALFEAGKDATPDMSPEELAAWNAASILLCEAEELRGLAQT